MTTPAFQLLDRLSRHATDHGERAAVIEATTRAAITYRQLQSDVRDFANDLNARLPTGSTVVLRCPNVRRFHTAFLGTLAAGMTVFPIPCGMTETEVESIKHKSGAIAIVTDHAIQDFKSSARTTDTPALLLQSSGTTGLPKIVRRDLGSLDAVSAQMVEAIDIEQTDHMLSCVPLCHSYGLEHGLLAPLWAGATVHLADGFDLDVVRRQLTQSDVTVFSAVPSVCEMMANLHDANDRFPTLRLAYSAGGVLPASIFEKLQSRCGITVGQLYGATEIGSITFAHPRDAGFDSSSVGRPMHGVELRVDGDDQLFVRAASMMSGYIGDESTMTPDGFFPTGDLARIDAAGNLHITGRLKFLIDVGGLKVNPMEVELAIAEHPDVAACVVVPVRLSETVSRLKAVVTAADPAHPPAIDARCALREKSPKQPQNPARV